MSIPLLIQADNNDVYHLVAETWRETWGS